MIEPITTPGKTYAVTSPNGCTVTTDDGITLAEIEAGKQGYFVAVSGKVQLSDDSAILTQLFKLAPQQRLAILGVLGGNAGGLPAGYKRVEYIENPKMAYLETNLEYSSEATIKIDFRDDQGASGSNGGFPYLFGGNASGIEAWSVGYAKDQTRWKWNNQRTYDFNNIIELGRRYLVELNKTGGYLDGIKKSSIVYSEWHAQSLTLFKQSTKTYTSGCKMYSAEVTENGDTLLNVVPCLDETGAPCMFDLVSRKAFYTKGTDDFRYPSETATYALRRVLPDWGKLTEHGLRRLYHAPANYKGELYDYAVENGYKPIVETEQPEEGYWAPRWTETEDEIILEWVEAEPPMDEPLTETE